MVLLGFVLGTLVGALAMSRFTVRQAHGSDSKLQEAIGYCDKLVNINRELVRRLEKYERREKLGNAKVTMQIDIARQAGA